MLRHCLGIEGQRVFDNLPSSRAVAVPSPATTSAAATSGLLTTNVYQHAVDALSAHFKRSCDVSLERHRFRRRHQQPRESLSDYLSTLRDMAVPANFGSQQDENIREQFTAGVIRERLLLDSTLPFEQVVKIVLNIERVKAEAKEITTAVEMAARGEEQLPEIDRRRGIFLLARSVCRASVAAHAEAVRKAVSAPTRQENRNSLCSGKAGRSFLVLVQSASRNTERRNAIRDTWASPTKDSFSGIRLGFVLGTPRKASLNDKVLREADEYRDIIMSNFTESYYNLSLSTVTLLRWAVENCAGYDYLVKADDDAFLNLTALRKVFKTLLRRMTTDE
ncbi:putative galactosyltransferase [Ixodes scapularis]